jgi:HEAT repeat protein
MNASLKTITVVLIFTIFTFAYTQDTEEITKKQIQQLTYEARAAVEKYIKGATYYDIGYGIHRKNPYNIDSIIRYHKFAEQRLLSYISTDTTTECYNALELLSYKMVGGEKALDKVFTFTRQKHLNRQWKWHLNGTVLFNFYDNGFLRVKDTILREAQDTSIDINTKAIRFLWKIVWKNRDIGDIKEEYLVKLLTKIIDLYKQKNIYSWQLKNLMTVIGDIRTQSAIPILKEVLAQNPYDEDKKSILQTLVNIGDYESIEVLRKKIFQDIKPGKMYPFRDVKAVVSHFDKQTKQELCDVTVNYLETEKDAYSWLSPIEILAQCGDKRVGKYMIRHLELKHEYMSRNIANLAGEYKVEEVVDALINYYKRTYENRPFNALKKIASPKTFAFWVEILDDKYFRKRTSACEVLGDIGSRKALPLLQRCLNDSSEVVQITAREAIAKIEKQPLLPIFVDGLKTRDYHTRLKYSEKIIESGKDAVPHILKILPDADIEVQMWLAWVLSKIGDPAAIKPLQKLSNIGVGAYKDCINEAIDKLLETQK